MPMCTFPSSTPISRCNFFTMAFTYDVIPFHTSNEHEQTSIITRKTLIFCSNFLLTHWQNQLDRLVVARDCSHKYSPLPLVWLYTVSGPIHILKLKLKTRSMKCTLTGIISTHAWIIRRTVTVAHVLSFTKDTGVRVITLCQVQYIFRKLYLSVTNFWQFSSRCFAPYAVQYD